MLKYWQESMLNIDQENKPGKGGGGSMIFSINMLRSPSGRAVG